MKTLFFFSRDTSLLPGARSNEFSLCGLYVVCAELKLHLDGKGSVWVELLAWDVLGEQQWTEYRLQWEWMCAISDSFLSNTLTSDSTHTHTFTTTTITERSDIISHPKSALCLMGRLEKWSKTNSKQTKNMRRLYWILKKKKWKQKTHNTLKWTMS